MSTYEDFLINIMLQIQFNSLFPITRNVVYSSPLSKSIKIPATIFLVEHPHELCLPILYQFALLSRMATFSWLWRFFSPCHLVPNHHPNPLFWMPKQCLHINIFRLMQTNQYLLVVSSSSPQKTNPRSNILRIWLNEALINIPNRKASIRFFIEFHLPQTFFSKLKIDPCKSPYLANLCHLHWPELHYSSESLFFTHLTQSISIAIKSNHLRSFHPILLPLPLILFETFVMCCHSQKSCAWRSSASLRATASIRPRQARSHALRLQN